MKRTLMQIYVDMTLTFTTRIPITATNPKLKFLLLQNKQKMPADNNGRIGVMAAVVPQKRQYKLETLYPAGSSVEAATSQNCRNVSSKRAIAQRQNDRF